MRTPPPPSPTLPTTPTDHALQAQVAELTRQLSHANQRIDTLQYRLDRELAQSRYDVTRAMVVRILNETGGTP
ncbi:hypothetical protein UFOVP706_17 [uncultured Caudovirales phage]|jgi:nitrate/nitrite-specific signal transduction histidine kinase|uniref:Uncharacterized protein n=1 Tax=uncultured Caudovirales phage TaxID=2100421 RepID=A0A6J5NH28_9CAUD|nr:hypothetical protein UFOVP706_17 [uncultured Caudovirales phage]